MITHRLVLEHLPVHCPVSCSVAITVVGTGVAVAVTIAVASAVAAWQGGGGGHLYLHANLSRNQ